MMPVVDDLLELQDKTLYENGIRVLQQGWKNACVNLNGDYVEKQRIALT